MYANAVIESLYRLREQGFESLRINKNTLAWLANKIHEAQKFTMEPDENGQFMSCGQVSFMKENGGVELPYETTWLDYQYSQNMMRGEWRGYKSTTKKRGVLAISLGKGLFTLFLFNHMTLKKGDCVHDGWTMSPFEHTFAVDHSIYEHLDVLEELHPGLTEKIKDSPLFIPKYSNVKEKNMLTKEQANSISFPLYTIGEEGPGSDADIQSAIDCVDIAQFNVFLKLLSCKNISTQAVEPDAKLNKSRQKKGKLPLYSYRVLRLTPGTGTKGGGEDKGLWSNRVHLCRGHFKEFTEDKPLLGKHTGRYWWQPSVRGRNKDGVVLKDYEMRIPKTA